MSFKEYFQKDMYDIQNTKEVRELQLEKLRLRLQHFHERSFIIKLFLDAASIDPSTITLEQFRQAVPISLRVMHPARCDNRIP